MKAWKEIDEDPNMTVCHTSYSQYYIDHGCKIELFNDGVFEIKNTMTNSDHYEDVSEEVYNIFKNDGWIAGSFTVCAHVHERKARKTEHLIKLAEINEKFDVANRLLNVYENHVKKSKDYRMRIEKIYSSL